MSEQTTAKPGPEELETGGFGMAQGDDEKVPGWVWSDGPDADDYWICLQPDDPLVQEQPEQYKAYVPPSIGDTPHNVCLTAALLEWEGNPIHNREAFFAAYYPPEHRDTRTFYWHHTEVDPEPPHSS